MQPHANENELLDRLHFVAYESAKGLLDLTGEIRPFGITFATSGDSPKTFFPQDGHPSASWEELIDLVIEEMRYQAGTSALDGIAMVTQLESENERALAVQVETASGLVQLLIYPFAKRFFQWRIAEPQTANDLLFGSVFL